MKKVNFIFVIFIMVSLGLFGIFLFSSKSSYGTQEGRTFSLKPQFHFFEIAKSSKIDALEMYYQDHFSFRSSLLEQGANIKKILGMNIQNGVYIGKDGYLLEQPTEVKDSDLLIHYINEFYKTYNDLNISLILLPSHVTVNPSKAPNNVPIFDEYHQMKSIYHQVTVNTIDVVPVLKKGLEDYDMYYHLDSNLTSYAAYYVYKEYARLNDLIELPITEFDIEEVTDSFAGDLVKKVYTFSYKKDWVVKFIPKNGLRLSVLYGKELSDNIYHDEKKDSVEDYFLGSKEPLIQITNHIVGEKEILIVKDNSANVIVPFFVNDYEKVHVIDSASYKGSISDYLEEHKEIKDVVFIYKMNGLDAKISDSLK